MPTRMGLRKDEDVSALHVSLVIPAILSEGESARLDCLLSNYLYLTFPPPQWQQVLHISLSVN
jgi:hypothetical protein